MPYQLGYIPIFINATYYSIDKSCLSIAKEEKDRDKTRKISIRNSFLPKPFRHKGKYGEKARKKGGFKGKHVKTSKKKKENGVKAENLKDFI